MKIFPIGARVFVDPIEPIDEVTARAAAAGLHAVILDENVPKPTEGRVIAIGSDPMIQELIKIGDIVTFSKFAGHEQMVEGRTYRSLELREIIACIRPDPPNSQSTLTSQIQASVEEEPPSQ
jgi:co-chaperonin GroES (HSP10)